MQIPSLRAPLQTKQSAGDGPAHFRGAHWALQSLHSRSPRSRYCEEGQAVQFASSGPVQPRSFGQKTLQDWQTLLKLIYSPRGHVGRHTAVPKKDMSTTRRQPMLVADTTVAPVTFRQLAGPGPVQPVKQFSSQSRQTSKSRNVKAGQTLTHVVWYL